MTVEKENKVDMNNIGSRSGNIEYDCKSAGEVGGADNPTVCFQNATIAYITSGNAISSIIFRRIGVVLNGETQARDNFILELGFRTWQDIHTSDPIRNIHDDAMVDLLEKALLIGGKVDICVNSKRSNGYRIIDVALKK